MNSTLKRRNSINAWSKIPHNFVRLVWHFRPRHIYSKTLLVDEFLTCFIFFVLLFFFFHAHESRKHYLALSTLVDGARILSNMSFQVEIDHVRAYDTWMTVIIIVLYFYFITSFFVIFMGICGVAYLPRVFNCVQRYCTKRKAPQDCNGAYHKGTAANEEELVVLNCRNNEDTFSAVADRRQTSSNSITNCARTENPTDCAITENERSSLDRFPEKNSEVEHHTIFYWFLLLAYILQTLLHFVFGTSLGYLTSLAAGKTAEQILHLIDTSARRNVKGWEKIETDFKCCGYAMKSGDVNHNLIECQSDEETINCTQKLNDQIISLTALQVYWLCFLAVCVCHVCALCKCFQKVSKDIKMTKRKMIDKATDMTPDVTDGAAPLSGLQMRLDSFVSASSSAALHDFSTELASTSTSRPVDSVAVLSGSEIDNC